MFKKKNLFLVAGSVIMTSAIVCSISACSFMMPQEEPVEEVPQKLTAENIAPGVFKQYIDVETLASKLTGSYSIGARAEFWYEENTLILTNNNNPNRSKCTIEYKDQETTCRYELVKDMYIANRGFIHHQAYFGTYVFNEEEQTVTLNLPEYSYQYIWSGDNIATNPKSETLCAGLLGSEGVKGDPAKGFAYDYYNTATAKEPQKIRINLKDGTYSCVSIFEADDQ